MKVFILHLFTLNGEGKKAFTKKYLRWRFAIPSKFDKEMEIKFGEKRILSVREANYDEKNSRLASRGLWKVKVPSKSLHHITD